MEMSEYRRSRRGFIKTVAAGVVGLAVGGVAGYLAAPREAPGPAGATVTKTETIRQTVTQTQTVTAGAKPRGIPSEPLKIGLINPISGGAAPLGDPGVKGAQLAAEIINERGGILGRKIQLLDPLDTKAKPDVAVDLFTRLVEAEGVEYVVGGISSAEGLALADAADALGAIWLPCEVWTPQLTEKKRKFTFRLTWIDSAAGVGAALMALTLKPDVKTIAGINPDYAHGRDQWESFKLAMKRLKPDVEVVAELFHPLLATSDFGPYITKLREAKPDVVQSTNWGGDKLTFFKQAIPTGYFKETIHLDVCQLGLEIHTREDWPEGIWGGSQYVRFYPPWSRWPANKEFNERFVQRFGEKAFGMSAQSAANTYTDLFAIKAGIERAAAFVGGWPDIDEVAESMVGMQVISPKGVLTIREDHDMSGPQIWAKPKFVAGKDYPIVDPKDVITFPPELTNPTPGVPWRDWINNM